MNQASDLYSKDWKAKVLQLAKQFWLAYLCDKTNTETINALETAIARKKQGDSDQNSGKFHKLKTKSTKPSAATLLQAETVVKGSTQIYEHALWSILRGDLFRLHDDIKRMATGAKRRQWREFIQLRLPALISATGLSIFDRLGYALQAMRVSADKGDLFSFNKAQQSIALLVNELTADGIFTELASDLEVLLNEWGEYEKAWLDLNCISNMRSGWDWRYLLAGFCFLVIAAFAVDGVAGSGAMIFALVTIAAGLFPQFRYIFPLDPNQS
ncbi:hypothetical protein [Alterisphingorhabdus coralli]|uniref:Uncharacterized protein n=1 Tax=Alterisphingorhabdus coralli TaxID=3071408 RepID=A0AA97F495_9SPHN|nr:hypothetical protein [Parasphingorhabdus sp. SCSIO 66989]WOE74034.1 hypothetical protein RB602_09185 [Parasphingorhabdus sp. SCSIO 66989]